MREAERQKEEAIEYAKNQKQQDQSIKIKYDNLALIIQKN